MVGKKVVIEVSEKNSTGGTSFLEEFDVNEVRPI